MPPVHGADREKAKSGEEQFNEISKPQSTDVQWESGNLGEETKPRPIQRFQFSLRFRKSQEQNFSETFFVKTFVKLNGN